MDRRPRGTSARASWEETSNPVKKDFQKTRDCQVNRGFFIGIEPPEVGESTTDEPMNKRIKRVPATFAPETRFQVKPLPPAPFRAFQETKFEQLKSALLREALVDAPDPSLNSRLRFAANEAAALAWATTYPLLVFPVLFAEKTAAALGGARRPEVISQPACNLVAV